MVICEYDATAWCVWMSLYIFSLINSERCPLRCCSSQFPVTDAKHEKTSQSNEPPLCSPKQLRSVQSDGLCCPKQLSRKTSSRCMKINMRTLTFHNQFARDKGLISHLSFCFFGSLQKFGTPVLGKAVCGRKTPEPLSIEDLCQQKHVQVKLLI